MIELAPHHKSGLNLSSPIMIASGFCGYGDAYQRLFNISDFGAVITQPITLRPRRGTPQPRLVETTSGFILDTGQQNPGVKKVIQHYSKSWSRLGVPIIAHLPADEPDDLRRTARALANIQSPHGDPVLAGFELGLPQQARSQDVEQWLKAIQQGSELPILVKLPLPIISFAILEVAANAYADALVIGTPPLGMAFSLQPITGPLYSPTLVNFVLYALQQASDIGLPLIATGGIHNLTDVENFLKADATAVQLDSLLFVDPNLAATLGQAFN